MSKSTNTERIERGPPDGYDYGERTIQAERVQGQRPPQYWGTDVEEIRERYGISPLDPDTFRDREGYRMTYPDMLIHERDPEITSSSKGADCLVAGPKDSGKTTLALNISAVEMERGEKVIWRGSRERSGWLPYRDWTTLFLPENADVDAVWMNEEADTLREEIEDLEDVVRDVKRYEDVRDLCDQLGDQPEGSFNVVYPDPSFSGCEEETQRSNRVPGSLPFRSESDVDGGEVSTPQTHWWFAFLLARTEYGPFEWWTFISDESNDIFPREASNDAGDRLRDKIKLLRGLWASSRKRLLSMVWFAHHEETIAPRIRRQFEWRICMPGRANPRRSRASSIPLGFGTVGMKSEFMSDKDPGLGLCYQDGKTDSWTRFGWSDIDVDGVDDERWLRVTLVEPVETDESSDEPTPSVEFDDSIFGEWQNQSDHRLFVKAPGTGKIDVTRAEVIEDLESPVEDLEFVDDLADQGRVRVVKMRSTTDQREIEVARVPKPDRGFKSEAESGGEPA
ncbi:hypothetical protein [Halorhabdus amylolytica]|uniref:hypothetical protein n=1 Tax=Halorhabdus amylolytica TaxID=2559573 RepID=UPI0010AACC05|nr:hypothetical protein [Halorhabdus amylolytica]